MDEPVFLLSDINGLSVLSEWILRLDGVWDFMIHFNSSLIFRIYEEIKPALS